MKSRRYDMAFGSKSAKDGEHKPAVKGPPSTKPSPQDVYRALNMTEQEEKRTRALFHNFRMKVTAEIKKAKSENVHQDRIRESLQRLQRNADEELNAILGPERAKKAIETLEH